jgi:hypothetical protein
MTYLFRARDVALGGVCCAWDAVLRPIRTVNVVGASVTLVEMVLGESTQVEYHTASDSNELLCSLKVLGSGTASESPTSPPPRNPWLLSNPLP